MTNQPCYHCVENIGDADPFVHGGAFVCVDKFNVYHPILLILDTCPDHEHYTHRLSEITLDRCFPIKKNSKLIGIGSNPYHTEICEWFGNEASLETLANFTGRLFDSFVGSFCSSYPVERALAYKVVADYYGLQEFDQYPREFEEEKAKLFCDKMLEQIAETKGWWEGYFKKDVS
jgi:hypothetical protein